MKINNYVVSNIKHSKHIAEALIRFGIPFSFNGKILIFKTSEYVIKEILYMYKPIFKKYKIEKITTKMNEK